MTRIERLYRRIRASPNNCRFGELCRLVEAAGYEFARYSGDHRIYIHPTKRGVLINLQDCKGKAIPYQVRQVLGQVEALGFLED